MRNIDNPSSANILPGDCIVATSAQRAALSLAPEDAGKVIVEKDSGRMYLATLTEGAKPLATNLAAELAAIGMSMTYPEIAAALGYDQVALDPIAVVQAFGNSTIASTTPFAGWGQEYSVPNSAFAFSHLYIHGIRQLAASTADWWKTLTITVRAGSKDGAILATGTYDIPVYSYTSVFGSVLFELSSTVTAAACGAKYWVDIVARDSAGALCPCGYPRVTTVGAIMSNNVWDSTWYLNRTSGLWVKATLASEPTTGYHLPIEPRLSPGVSYKSTRDGQNPVIVLPPLYGVVGRQMNLYFDGLGERLPRNIVYDVVCTEGVHQDRRWYATPSSPGSYSLTVDAKNPWTLETMATATTTVSVAESTASVNATLLCIGDSTTAGGEVTAELQVLDTADADMALALIGTQGIGTNKHEGRSGWKSYQFCESGSPFFIGGIVDFSSYLSTNSLATPTHVIIHLGINDMFGSTTEAEAISAKTLCVQSISRIVFSIQKHSSSIKIGVALPIPPSAEQNAFGANYYAGQNIYRYSENLQKLLIALNAAFANQTSSKVWLLPYSVSIDTVNNMQTTTGAVNSRNATTVVRQSNGVHPAASGYLQIADAALGWLKNNP